MAGSASKSRRRFIRTSTYAGVSLIGMRAFALNELPPEDKRSILIAHTNDMHSHIDPFPDNDPKYPGLGGMADRAAVIDDLRRRHGDILLLDAGDIFQGTPYFNYFGGEIELDLMSRMGYDAATMGNHDFDGGMDGFLKAKKKANFPFICSNYDFTDTLLEGQTIGHQVFERNGLRIGVFGVGVELEGLVDPRLCKGVRYNAPITVALQKSRFLRLDKGCDLVVCLSHLGYSYKSEKVSDLKLAAACPEIDLIIGGHTHTFLDNPTRIGHSGDNFTLVNQVGWAGVRLGKIEFELSKDRVPRGRGLEARMIGREPQK